jgi:hypothetical protein
VGADDGGRTGGRALLCAVCVDGRKGPTGKFVTIDLREDDRRPSGDHVGWADNGPLALPSRTNVVPLGLCVSWVNPEPSGLIVYRSDGWVGSGITERRDRS